MVAARVTMIAGMLAVAGAIGYFGMLLLQPTSMETWVPTRTDSQRALVGVIPLLAGLFLMVLGLPREPAKTITRLPEAQPLRVQLKPPTAPPRAPSPVRSAGAPRPPNPREALLARLEDINAKLNRAKVQFGLGALSAQGYDHYVKKLDGERAEIEQQLLDAELHTAPAKTKEN